MSTSPVIGLFVGGRGSRMGGADKGLLRAPDGATLIERLVGVARAASPSAPLVLVGRAAAYTHLGLPAIEDAPSGVGPLGGLRALLALAQARGHGSALALSCDLPFITPELVRRLIAEQPAALALAPRTDGRWSPLTARYSVSALASVDAALAAGEHALQRLMTRLGPGAAELAVDASERDALRDWDRPEDVQRTSRG